eukprot:4850439-Amphidinium_carterae.1
MQAATRLTVLIAPDSQNMKWNSTQTRLQTEHKQPMDTYRPSESKRFKEDQAHEFDGPIAMRNL